MNLYEIDRAIEACVDPETGEIIDLDRLNDLVMERDTKIENVALWYKSLIAESKAIAEEKKALEAREKAAKNKAEGLKNWLSAILGGSKFKTARCAISYRSSSSVLIEGGAEIPEEYCTIKVDPSKTKLKEALDRGEQIPGVSLLKSQNIQIK